MVDISVEADHEIEARLLRVIGLATLTAYPVPYMFQEFPLDAFPGAVSPEALALVRDDQLWSQLVPADGRGEAFTLFRFHFPDGVDNSGFVGWLASILKRRFGSGVFVSCGHNAGRGGIYDYWGVPVAIGPDVLRAVRALRHETG
ncbi:DUF6196 family protein [Rhizosaccharibacter radicis]|uniref:DUF6196 family protein n=1 Tax=Rhizosaccharibacter radicis TaxID=2782605 RepID=A0ABT1VUM3_9PROT|nr:DUF6196 family protein [Acetobacteraceae bacterium KSS12]